MTVKEMEPVSYSPSLTGSFALSAHNRSSGKSRLGRYRSVWFWATEGNH